MLTIDEERLISTGLARKTAIDFVESLRDYERESHNLLGFDERTTEELFDKFLETYHK